MQKGCILSIKFFDFKVGIYKKSMKAIGNERKYFKKDLLFSFNDVINHQN